LSAVTAHLQTQREDWRSKTHVQVVYNAPDDSPERKRSLQKLPTSPLIATWHPPCPLAPKQPLPIKRLRLLYVVPYYLVSLLTLSASRSLLACHNPRILRHHTPNQGFRRPSRRLFQGPYQSLWSLRCQQHCPPNAAVSLRLLTEGTTLHQRPIGGLMNQELFHHLQLRAVVLQPSLLTINLVSWFLEFHSQF